MTTRTPEVYMLLAGLLATVSLASLIGLVLRLRKPGDSAIRNLNARIWSWWVMTLICGGVLLAGPVAITLLFAFISAVALREFSERTLTEPCLPWTAPLWTGLLVALPVQYLAVGMSSYELLSIWIPVYCFVALAAVAVFFTGIERILERTAAAFWGLIVCVYCVSHIPALMMLRIPGYQDRTVLLPVFLVLIAQSSDIMQYVWGKLFGRHLLAPRLSPSKTIEGLVGGVLSATLLGVLLRSITPFTKLQAGLMAFLIATLGVLSGLVMSAIKRDRGIKDWGCFIAGHGGMLDRIDSLCFSAPIFFHLTRHFFSQH